MQVDAPVWPVRVYYEDTDASGVVYHARYLAFFERARSEALRAAGFSQQQLIDEQQVAFTLANIRVHYRKPARLDDELLVHTRLHCRRALIEFEHRLCRVEDNDELATAQVRAGCVGLPSFKPIRIPVAILTALEGLHA